MNSKMKMTLLAGALALAVAGPASATILGSGAGGNGDLILSVWDTTSQTSYTADLGVTMNAFLGGAVVNGGASFVAGNGGNGGVSSVFGANATLTSFLASISANSATTLWNVTALDTTGTGANGVRILSTATAGTAPINSLVSVLNFGPVNAYYDAASTLSGAATSVIAANATNPTAYAGTSAFGTNFGGKTTAVFGSNAAALGASQNFFFLTPSSTLSVSKATLGQFSNATGASTWTLSSTGALTYAVAAVPEPGEWLLMLSGLCLVGFIATRRKEESSMTFA